MDTGSYSPETIQYITDVITEDQRVTGRNYLAATRAAVHVYAQLIANCVLGNAAPPAQWLDAYRYARDLSEHEYVKAEQTLGRIDGHH